MVMDLKKNQALYTNISDMGSDTSSEEFGMF